MAGLLTLDRAFPLTRADEKPPGRASQTAGGYIDASERAAQ